MSWTLVEIAGWCGGTLSGDRATLVAGISTDTRTLRKGDLYVAIRGERFDGHDFVDQAVARGAVAALISQPGRAAPGVPSIRVADTVAGLGAIARGHRSRFEGPVIAITGSNGKTTTKEMCAEILGQAGRRVRKTPGNFNNQIGLPLSILGLDEADQVMVLELGMNHAGEIDALARITAPTIGAITQVAAAHLGPLGSLDAIARAKGELLDHLTERGVAVLNMDDPQVMAQGSRCAGRVMTFGFAEAADFRATRLELHPDGTRFALETPAGSTEVAMDLPGRHLVQDALCAAAAAHSSGLIEPKPLECIRLGVRRFVGMNGRTVVRAARAGFRLLDDSYNANPVSVEAALHALDQLSGGGRLVAVLGDMLELGPEAPELHARVGRAAAEVGVEVLLGVGALSANTVEAARSAGVSSAELLKDAAAAATRVRELIREGDTILVKGSRATGLETVAAALLESN